MTTIELLAIAGCGLAFVALIHSMVKLINAFAYNKEIIAGKNNTNNIFIIDPTDSMRFFLGTIARDYSNVFGFAREQMIESLLKKGVLPKVVIINRASHNIDLHKISESLKKYDVLDTTRVIIFVSRLSDKSTAESQHVFSNVVQTMWQPFEPVWLRNTLDDLVSFPGRPGLRLRQFKFINDPETKYDYNFRQSPIKRVFDILISATILLLLSPIFIFVAIVIKLESKGPVFYAGRRAGKGFKVFHHLKFRTMEIGADKKIKELAHLNQYNVSDRSGAYFFKISNDPRVTSFGRFLRNSNLDELPSFLNVLLGDLSVVGNRSLPLYEANTLTTDEYVERFLAPAGIFGLWQMSDKTNPNLSVEERINLDIAYARKRNMIFDLIIIAKTAFSKQEKELV